MKKCIAVISVFVLAMNLGACGKDGHNAYKEIYERYVKMKSYSAIAEVTVKNERTENCYVAQQKFLAPDCFVNEILEPKELAGCGYVFQNGELTLKSGVGNGEKVPKISLESVGVLSVNDFFESYYKSEETAVLTSKGRLQRETVLECFLNSKNENRFKQRLWVDNETFLPIKLETYDTQGRVVVKVEFREFDRNCKIDESEFDQKNG